MAFHVERKWHYLTLIRFLSAKMVARTRQCGLCRAALLYSTNFKKACSSEIFVISLLTAWTIHYIFSKLSSRRPCNSDSITPRFFRLASPMRIAFIISIIRKPSRTLRICLVIVNTDAYDPIVWVNAAKCTRRYGSSSTSRCAWSRFILQFRWCGRSFLSVYCWSSTLIIHMFGSGEYNAEWLYRHRYAKIVMLTVFIYAVFFISIYE